MSYEYEDSTEKDVLQSIQGVLCDISETLMQIRDLAQQAMAEVVDEALAEEAAALNIPTRES